MLDKFVFRCRLLLLFIAVGRCIVIFELLFPQARLQITEAAPTLGLLRATVSVEAQLFVLQRNHFPNVRYTFPLIVSDI